jgi:hypothetical protein
VLLAAAALVGAVAVASTRASTASPGLPTATHARAIDSGPAPAIRPARLARAVPSFRGGPTTASTGEILDVRVSDSLPPTSTPESWAEVIAGVLHGPEISLLRAYVLTFDEVQDICGNQALGCYSGNQMVVPGEVLADGTLPEEIIRHEYGHHVAFNRVNPPWIAIDYGPKHWASVANVCARVARKEAFPGDQGSNYPRNPGEAWAETYRLLDERRKGIATATWPIIAPSFYPTEEALVAAERDVVEPWTAPTTTTATRAFTKRSKKVWLTPLPTPLDGELRIGAVLPSAGEYEVALLGGDKRTVMQRAQWVSQRVKRLTTTVCGSRSLFVRVTRSGPPGRVRLSITTP